MVNGSQPRHPLQTLSFSVENLQPSPKREPLRRLKKWDMALVVNEDKFMHGGYRSSASPTPSTSKNVLARSYRRRNKTLEHSEFVEAEAVESDDDEMRGFSGFGKKTNDGDEESNGEDLDKTLEELVDDKEMNEQEVAKDKILEKHQFVHRLDLLPDCLRIYGIQRTPCGR